MLLFVKLARFWYLAPCANIYLIIIVRRIRDLQRYTVFGKGGVGTLFNSQNLRHGYLDRRLSG